MTKRYQIEISEIKGKFNFGKNPWYVEIPLTIFVGIPLIIFGGLFWLLANGFYYVFHKPFEKEKTWKDLTWKEFASLERLTLEKSEPINLYLDKKEQEWFDEDQVYAIRTDLKNNLLDGKVFSEFIHIFDNKIFLQELVPIDSGQKFEIKSRLIALKPENIELEDIKEFDYYYLEAKTENDEMNIKGTDQLGSKFELKIKNTLANNG